MISPNPVVLGIFWSCCIIPVLFTPTSGQDTEKETHRVYSYTYHFQHNGTNPREFLQEILSGPDFTGDDRTVIKTISNPSFRGFVTKGVFPAGPPTNYNHVPGFGSPRDISIDGIKKIVQDTIQRLPPRLAPRLPPPPPLPPIPPPPADLPGNFLRDNGPGDFLKQVVRPVDRDHVVTNVENFVRHTPVGRVVGQTETFSYNPPPINNVVNNIEGFRKSEQIVSHDQRSRGHVTQSFFSQNFNSNSPPGGNNRRNVFGQRLSRVNNAVNGNNEWWKTVRNVANSLGNVNRGHDNNANSVNTGSFVHQNNNVYGREGNRNKQQGNENFVPDLPNFNNHRPAPVGNFGHRSSPLQHVNANLAQGRTNYDGQTRTGNYENVDPGVRQNGVNAVNFGRNNNPHIQRNLGGINNPVVWDDNRNDGLNTQNNYGNWGNRISRDDNNVQSRGDQNRNNFGSANIRPFSNAHSGPSQNNALQNPADFLKSTLEALVPGAKLLNIPPFPNEGNFGNSNGGGQQRVYGSDIISRGPNSFSRNTERGYHRNFEVTSNNGWSADNVRRLGADSSRLDFNKDFIDVFKDDYSSN